MTKKQIKVISLDRIVGITAFLSNPKSQDKELPPIMDMRAENKTAL